MGPARTVRKLIQFQEINQKKQRTEEKGLTASLTVLLVLIQSTLPALAENLVIKTSSKTQTLIHLSEDKDNTNDDIEKMINQEKIERGSCQSVWILGADISY